MSSLPRQPRARPLPVQLHLAHADVRQMPQLRLWQAGPHPAAAGLAWRRSLAFLAAS